MVTLCSRSSASYAFSDVKVIYPITSSVMAEATDEWATRKKEHLLVGKYRLLKCSLRLVLQVQFTDSAAVHNYHHSISVFF